MLPATTARVVEQTPDYINERIRQKTEENIARYSAAGPEAVRQRLADLDREWDIERMLEVNASAVILTGLALSIFSWSMRCKAGVRPFLYSAGLA
jgi:hypothetical protein